MVKMFFMGMAWAGVTVTAAFVEGTSACVEGTEACVEGIVACAKVGILGYGLSSTTSGVH